MGCKKSATKKKQNESKKAIKINKTNQENVEINKIQ